jgi:hypothetical protein
MTAASATPRQSRAAVSAPPLGGGDPSAAAHAARCRAHKRRARGFQPVDLCPQLLHTGIYVLHGAVDKPGHCEFSLW